MTSPSAPPPPPDPVATAKAQADTNLKTAVTQYGLNATNQVTPYGNLSYKQIGQWEDGTPRFEATQSLSPEEQQLYQQGTANQNALGRIGGEQINRVGELLSRPVDLNNDAVEASLMERGRQQLDPILAQRRSQRETQLANQGITHGSEAWGNEETQLSQGENDAYNNLILSGRGQAIQEALTARNQPLNEITALMSGSQVQQPNFVGTPQSQIASPDLAGLTMDAYKLGPLAGWNAQNSYNKALMGGIFGVAGSAAKMAAGGWGA